MKQKRQSINLWILFLVGWMVFLTPHILRGKAGAANRYIQVEKDSIYRTDSIALEMLQKPVELDSLLSAITIPVVDSLYGINDTQQTLNTFFHALRELRAYGDTVINVIHLGDSHIQAGYYSGRVMRLMHQEFGNAGRGWIAPFKLSKVNEPDDYFITSSVKEWVAGRAIQNVKKAPVGLGGIGIQTASPSVNMDVIIAPKNGVGYSFNKAVFFRGEKAMPMLPAGSIKDSVETFLDYTPAVPGIVTDTFLISCLTDTLQLHSTRRKQGTDSLLPASNFTNVYYGLNLTNGNPGVLYHSIGVNGSMFVNYTDDHYVKQLALLNPSLLIISLGTNETFGARFRATEFSYQVKNFLRLVKEHLPETAVLLTTPPECYKRIRVDGKRTYTRNTNTELAAKAIVEVAREEGIACWDLFAATGGKNSNRKWFDKKLMGIDRVHFNKNGYREQGTLLFSALMQEYNKLINTEEIDEI